MKRLLSVAAGLVASLLLTGTAFAAGSLSIGMQLEPPNLDPTSGAAAPIDDVVYPNIFEGLVRLGPDGRVRPFLATSWEVSPDGLTYVFRLREGVRFHDGAALDAAAVKFSLDRAAAPASTNAQKAALSNIARVETPDTATVRLVLKAPDANLLRLLSLGDAVIVSPATAGQAATRPVGTGPFRYKDWRRGYALTLERNPDYWGRPPSLDQVTFKFIPDPVAALAAVKGGDVDAFPDFPAPENLAEFRADPRLRVAVGPTEAETILAINNRNGPLADLRVRRALAHALDRAAIIQGAMYGYGTPIGSHFPPQDPAYVDLTGRYPHDEAAARRLLAEAGYPNGFDVTLKLPPPNYARRSGEVIAAQLARVGIRAKIESLEWAQWLEQVFGRHDFDLTVVAHSEAFDYDIYGRDDYYFGYRSAEVKRILQALKVTPEGPERTALLQAFQRRISDDAVNGYLFQFPRLGVWDARLQGLWFNGPTQSIDLAGASFEGQASAAGRASGGRGGWPALAALLLVVAGLAWIALRFGVAWLLRRAGVAALTLLAASAVIFVLLQIAPGDPAAYMMGLNASPEALATLRDQLGLSGPPLQRWFDWISGVGRGDFGVSYTYQVPVGGLIAERLAVSLPLSVYATLLSVTIGVPLGLWAASRRGRPADMVLMGISQIGVALPSFWAGMLLIIVFSTTLHWFGAGGFPGWEAGLGRGLQALTLPATALALPQAAILARVARSATLDVLGEDYMRTALAKGLSPRAALWRHALPNALIPILTVLGLQLPYLIAGGVIVENVFYLPGLGRLIFQAVTQRDLIVVQGAVLVLVLATVLTNFVVDILYGVIDPRVRGRAA